MKTNFTFTIFFTLLIQCTTIDIQALSIDDTLSDIDKMILEEYNQKYRDYPVENLAITHLITNHIKSSSPTVVGNGMQLIYDLTDEHKKYFDEVLIEYLIKEISTGMTYREYRDKDSSFIRGIVTLGETRSEKSVEILFQLMEPYEKWPTSLKNPLKTNPDHSLWITKIRKYALDSLLAPKDKKGEELIPIIETKVNDYDTNKIGYSEVKRSIEFYKEYYAELKQGIDRFSLGGF